MTSLKTANTFRKYHRLLGFFLAGIMMIYACSGVLMIFRTTDFLKYEQLEEKQLDPALTAEELGQALRIKDFAVQEDTAEALLFKQGSYDKRSGLASVTKKQYPWVLQKMVGLHKATVNSPLFFMNIFFGAGLLFFAVSGFFMFIPKAPAFRSGLKFAAAGFTVALAVLLLG
ncbi:PepSY domain-containing protein [Haliea sp. E17]|uniref:PepSY domain-containing protein n=1 Tax=Haliea sp. E17 TaxID=3401576 RepID=UPI003AADF7AE